ncbi:hypothetical protein [Paenibacillus mucilaginosus]|uniref:Uncharacterized protein n=3 Tax=Paenibacillus mucilaginosus TaxID=61624 RepID=H6NB93_9BACL|nr:hypothetical protein [Paenibacillus mucilaginosus]AEI42520.1 hypothetical protein KNP414_03983 [Paenibacillus mucilaginosus KNP414]AFC32061.1 hypothetical protein PM3016_5358 [Paenibacillus mucilaginosus 3016]AFH64431.1 hypothetical protein B2K_27685 [Paenibacillus mucilaginosus K02]MCG7213913.1 hypothetical protein [Paenibacillus mucilaginosus]WDM25918.1 hypothetical protein KCX80_26230 [Paenibacillus mucilaginosus]
MLLSKQQKKLIVEILMKERRRLFSRHKGELLDRTIADLLQTVRNEDINITDPRDSSIDWGSRGRPKR